MNPVALTRFWMVLVYEENKNHMDAEDAYEFAIGDCKYEPIDTRFCMVYHRGVGWMLMEASGTAIVKVIEAGNTGKFE